ncbi:unnamed protein product [Schistosoma curassoni]|uniref:Uncharacterized protein n=1 Tax=Schistosoma curassoni TaxID=6186 RepID=A0A183L0M3_9TREM|nr:unnamed protein product [Schistosoma curassoni]
MISFMKKYWSRLITWKHAITYINPFSRSHLLCVRSISPGRRRKKQ